MGKQIYFRYKDSKLYENYGTYLDFIKSIPLSRQEIEEFDEFGYNILHYCAFKSNISTDIMVYVLSYLPNLYVLSGYESLTAFELAFLKNSKEKMDLLLKSNYDFRLPDDLGFKIEDKLHDIVKENPMFYKPIIEELKLDFDFEVKVDAQPKTLKTNSIVNNQKFATDVTALRLRIELENKLFDLIKGRIGHDLEELIINKSLHELILNSFALGLISYDLKEQFIKAKQVMNHYCHYQAAIDNRTEWFNMMSLDKQEDYFKFIKSEIDLL